VRARGPALALSRRADWERARARVPYVEDEDWQAKLAENPEALYRIIADSYDLVLRDREVEAGTQRSGRRPRPSRVPIDEVIAAVLPPRYSNDPFPVALHALLRGRSQRSFSLLVPCNQATLSRLLSGQLTPDLVMLERVAEAAGVGPWFFREWRAGYVAALVREVLTDNPSMSVAALRALQAKAKG
jgi:hypothetical protein